MGEVERKYHSQELHSSLRRTEQAKSPRRDLTFEDVAKVIEKDFKDTELFQDGQFIEMLKDRANEFGLPIELIVDAMRDLDKQVEVYGQTEALKEHAQHQAETAQDIQDTKTHLKQRRWIDALASSRDVLLGLAINGWKEAGHGIGFGLDSDIRQKKAEARQKTANMKQAMESVLKRAVDKHQLETFLRTGGPGLRSIVERFQKGRIGLAEFMNDPELIIGIDSMINATDIDTLNEYVLERAPDGTPTNVIYFKDYSPDKAIQIKTAIKGQLRAVARHQILTLATEKSQAIVSSDDYEPDLPGAVGTGKSIVRRASLSGTLWAIGLRGGGKLAIGGALGAGVLTGGSGIAIAVGLGAITGAARAYINSEKQINRKRVDASIGTDTQQVEVRGQMEDVVKAASVIELQLSAAIQEATYKQQEVARTWADLQRRQLSAERTAAQGVQSAFVDDVDYTTANSEMRLSMTRLYGILSDAHARLQRSRSLTKNRQDYVSFGYHDRAQAISEFASKLEVGLGVVGTYVDNLGDADKASMIQSMTTADIRNTELVDIIEERYAEKLKAGRGRKIINGAVRGGAVAGAVSFAMDYMFGGDANAPADVELIQPAPVGTTIPLNDRIEITIAENELSINPIGENTAGITSRFIEFPTDVDPTKVAFIPNADGSQINIVEAATGKSLHYINVSEETVVQGDMVVDDPQWAVNLTPDTYPRFSIGDNTYATLFREDSGVIEIYKQFAGGKTEYLFKTPTIYPEQVLDDPEAFQGIAKLQIEVSNPELGEVTVYSAIDGKIVAQFTIHEQLSPPAVVGPPPETVPVPVPPSADVPPAPVPDSPPVPVSPPADAVPIAPPTPPPPPVDDAPIPHPTPLPGAEHSTDHGTGTPGTLEQPTNRDPFSRPSLEKPTDHGTPTTPKLEKPTGATGDGTTGMAPTEKPSGPQVLEQAFANADTKAALDAIGVKPDAVTADDSGFHVSVADNEYLSATEGWRQTRLELLMEAQRQGLINPGEKPLEILSRIEQATNLALNEKGAHLDHAAALQKAFGMDIKDIRGGVMKYVTGEKGAGVDSRWATVVEQVAKLPKPVASADLPPASGAPNVDLGSATAQLDISPAQQAVGSSLLEYLPIASAHAEPLPDGMAFDNLRVTPLDLNTVLRPVGEQFIRAGMESGGGISAGSIATSTLFEQVAPLQDKAAKVKPAPNPELNATTNLPEQADVEYGRVHIYEKPFADPVVTMYALEESRQLESITTDIGALELAVSVARLPHDVAPNGVTDRQRRTERDIKNRYNSVFSAFGRIRGSSNIPDTTNIPGTQQTIGQLERQLSNRIVVAGVEFGYRILRRSERFSKQLKKDVDAFGSRATAYADDMSIDPNTKLVELRRRQGHVRDTFRDFKNLVDADLRGIYEDPAVVVKADFDAVQTEVRKAGFSLGNLEGYLRDQIYDLEQVVNPPTGAPIPVLARSSTGPLPVAVSGPPPLAPLPSFSSSPAGPPSPPLGPSISSLPPADPDYDIPVFGGASDPSTLSNDPIGSDPDDDALFGGMALPSGFDAGVDPNFGGWSDPDDEAFLLTNPISNDEEVHDLPAPLPDVGISRTPGAGSFDPDDTAGGPDIDQVLRPLGVDAEDPVTGGIVTRTAAEGAVVAPVETSAIINTDRLARLVPLPADAHPRFYDAVRAAIASTVDLVPVGLAGALGLSYAIDNAEVLAIRRQLVDAGVIDTSGKLLLDRRAVLVAELQTTETTDAKIVEALRENVTTSRRILANMLVVNRLCKNYEIHDVARAVEEINLVIGNAQRLGGFIQEAANHLTGDIRSTEVAIVRDWFMAQIDYFEREEREDFIRLGGSLSERALAMIPLYWTERITRMKEVRDQLLSSDAFSITDATDRRQVFARLEGVRTVIEHSSGIFWRANQELITAIQHPKLLEEIDIAANDYTLIGAAAFYRRILTHIRVAGGDLQAAGLLAADNTVNVENLKSLKLKIGASETQSDTYITDRDESYSSMEVYIGDVLASAVHDQNYRETMVTQGNYFNDISSKIKPLHDQFYNTPIGKAVLPDGRYSKVAKHGSQYHVLRAFELIPPDATPDNAELIPEKVDAFVKALLANQAVAPNPAIVADSMYKLTYGKEGAPLKPDALAAIAPAATEASPVGGPAASAEGGPSASPPEGPPAGDPALEQGKLLEKALYLVGTMYTKPFLDTLNTAMDSATMDPARRLEICNFALDEGRKASMHLAGDDKLSGRRLVYALGIRSIDDVVDNKRIAEAVAEIIKLEPPFEQDQQMVMDESTARLNEEVVRALGEEFGDEFALAITNQIPKGTNIRTQEVTRLKALGNFAFRWSELRRNKQPQVQAVMALDGNELLEAFGWHNGVDTPNVAAVRATAQRALDGLTPVFDSARFAVAIPETPPAVPAGDRTTEGPVVETTETVARREYDAMLKELSGDEGGFAKLKTARENAIANELKASGDQTPAEHEAARQVGFAWKRAFVDLEDRVKHYQGLAPDIKNAGVGERGKKTIKAEAENYWKQLHKKNSGELALMNTAIEAWSKGRVQQFGSELQSDLRAADVAVLDRIALVANPEGKFRKLYRQLDEDLTLLKPPSRMHLPSSDDSVVEARAVELKAHTDFAEATVKIADRWVGQMRAVEAAFGNDVGRTFLAAFATQVAIVSPAEQFQLYSRLLDKKTRTQAPEVALRAMNLINEAGEPSVEAIDKFAMEALREPTPDEQEVERLNKVVFNRFGGYMRDRLQDTIGALPAERQRELLTTLVDSLDIQFQAARSEHAAMLQASPHNLHGRVLDEAMRSPRSLEAIRTAVLEPLLLVLRDGSSAQGNMDIVVNRLATDVPVEGLFAGLIDQEAAVREIGARLDTVRARLGTSMAESVDTALRPLELPKQLELLDTLLNSIRENFEGLVTTNAGNVDKARHAILRQLHLATEIRGLIPENIAEVTTRLLAGTTGEALFTGLQTERAPDPAQLERNINKRLKIVEVRLGPNMRDGLAQDLTDVDPVRVLALVNVLLDSTLQRFEALKSEQSGNEPAARAALLRELHLATDRDVEIPDNMQEVANRLQAGKTGTELYAGLVGEIRPDPLMLEQDRDRRLRIVQTVFGPRMRNGLAERLATEPMERQVALLYTLLDSVHERYDILIEANGGDKRVTRDTLMTELHMVTDQGNPIRENLQTVGERLLAGTTGMELYAGLTSEIAGPPATDEERDNRLRSVDVRLGRRMADVVAERIAAEPLARQVELVGVLRDSVRERFTQLFEENGKAAPPARAALTKELHLLTERNQLIEANIQDVVTRLLAGTTGMELYAGLTTEVRQDPAVLEQNLNKRFSAVVWKFGGTMRDFLRNGIDQEPLTRQIQLTETLLDVVKDRFIALEKAQVTGTDRPTQEQSKAARNQMMRELNLTNLGDKPIKQNMEVVVQRLLAGVVGMELFAGLTVGGRGPRGGDDQGGPASGPAGDPISSPELGRGTERDRDNAGDRSRTGRSDTDRYDPDAYKRIGATMDYMMADMQRTPAYGYLVTERIADQGVLNTLHNEVNLGGKLFHEALHPLHEALVTFAETGPALIARFHLDTLPNLRTLATEMRAPNVTPERLRMILLSFERTSNGGPNSGPDRGGSETRTPTVDPIRNLVTAPTDAHPRFFEAVRGVIGESYVSESTVRTALGLGFDRADTETAQRVLRQLQTANVVDARGRVALDRKAVLAGDLGVTETTDSSIVQALNTRVGTLRAEVMGLLETTRRATPAIINSIAERLQHITTFINAAMDMGDLIREQSRRIIADMRGVEVLAVRDWLFTQADMFERDYNGVMRNAGKSLTDRVAIAERPHWVESINPLKEVRNSIIGSSPLSLSSTEDRKRLYQRIEDLESLAKITPDRYKIQSRNLREAIRGNRVLGEAIGEVATLLSPMQAAAYYRRLITHIETRGIDTLLGAGGTPNVETLRSLSFEQDAVAKASDVNILQRDKQGGYAYSYIGSPAFGAVNERIYLDGIGEQTKLFSTLTDGIFPVYKRFGDIQAVKALKTDQGKELVNFHVLRALELVPANATQTLEPVPARVDKLVENLRAGRVEINTAVVEDSVFALSNGKDGKALAAGSPEPPPGDDPDGADAGGKAEAIDHRNITLEASGIEIPNLVALEDTEDATNRALELLDIYNERVRIVGDRFPAIIKEQDQAIRGLLSAVRETIEPALQSQPEQTVGEYVDRLVIAIDEANTSVVSLRHEQDEFAASLRRKARALDEYSSSMHETSDQMRRAASILEEVGEDRARFVVNLTEHLEDVQRFLAQPGTVETAQPASSNRPDTSRADAPAEVETIDRSAITLEASGVEVPNDILKSVVSARSNIDFAFGLLNKSEVKALYPDVDTISASKEDIKGILLRIENLLKPIFPIQGNRTAVEQYALLRPVIIEATEIASELVDKQTEIEGTLSKRYNVLLERFPDADSGHPIHDVGGAATVLSRSVGDVEGLSYGINEHFDELESYLTREGLIELPDPHTVSVRESRLNIPRIDIERIMSETWDVFHAIDDQEIEDILPKDLSRLRGTIRTSFERLRADIDTVFPVQKDQLLIEYYTSADATLSRMTDVARELARSPLALIGGMLQHVDVPKRFANRDQANEALANARRTILRTAETIRHFSDDVNRHLTEMHYFLYPNGKPIEEDNTDSPSPEPTGPRPVDLPPAPGVDQSRGASVDSGAAGVRQPELPSIEITMLNRYLPDLADFNSGNQILTLEGSDTIDMRVGDFTCAVTVVESVRNHEITFTYPENNYLTIGISKNSKQAPDMRSRVGGHERKVATERGASVPTVDAILAFVNEMKEYYARTHPEDATDTVDYDEVSDPEAMEQNRPVRLQTFQDLFGQPSRVGLERALDAIETNDNRNMANATLLALMEKVTTRLTAAGGETLKTQTARRTALDFGSGKKIDADKLASLVAEARAEFESPGENLDTVDTQTGDISTDDEDAPVIDPDRLETMKVDLLGAIEPVRTLLASNMETNGTTYIESVGRLSGILERTPKFPQQNNFMTRLSGLSRNMESTQQTYRESVAVMLQRLDSDIPEHGIDANVMADISNAASEINTLQKRADADFERTTTLGVDLMTKLPEYEARNKTATEGKDIKDAVGLMVAPMKKIRDVLNVAAPDMNSALALAQGFQEEIYGVNPTAEV